MSKRLNNVYTLHDLREKGWTGREIRYVLLSAHYREQLNFTFDGLQAARSALQRIDEFLLKLWELVGPAPAPKVSVGCEPVRKLKTLFEAALDDDLNISAALGALFDFVRDTNKRLSDGSVTMQEAFLILDEWKEFDEVLGLGLPAKHDVPEDIIKLVIERNLAREAKDYKRADELRAELLKRGWEVKDVKGGGFTLKRVY
jgi:cysteinyl-tRNA synthetase